MAQETSIQYQTRIRDLPASDRPRERLRDAGPAALSNPELLAILLRTGSARESALAMATRMLSQHDGLVGLALIDLERPGGVVRQAGGQPLEVDVAVG